MHMDGSFSLGSVLSLTLVVVVARGWQDGLELFGACFRLL